MSEDKFDKTKDTVLAHIQNLFEEMEEEMAVSHQEKYALLEDSFENASDEEELRVAFEQWFSEHADDLSLDYGDAEDLHKRLEAVRDSLINENESSHKP